jgi:HSP20 family molecular chaperone IbpA
MVDEKKELQKVEGSYDVKRIFTPSVDIIERKDDILLYADMPGVDTESLDVTIEKNVLTIYGKVKYDIPEKYKLYLNEYDVGDYKRSFTISEEIDKDRIQAVLKNGVLKLVMPKIDVVKTRKIEVKEGN